MEREPNERTAVLSRASVSRNGSTDTASSSPGMMSQSPRGSNSVQDMDRSGGFLSSVGGDHDMSTKGRYRHLGSPRMQSSGEMFDSLIVSDSFLAFPMDSDKVSQGSAVAIFSLYSNMLASGGLVLVPWALATAGVWPGIGLLLLTTLISLHSCRLVVKRMHDPGVGGAASDFSEICRCYLGKWGERLSNWSMCLNDFFVLAVHWILISNFAYYGIALATDPIESNNETLRDFDRVLLSPNDTSCLPIASDFFKNISTLPRAFDTIWTLDRTVPAFVALAIFPLLHLPKPTFFAKFNTLVLMSVLQVILFLVIMAAAMGTPANVSNAISDTGSGWRYPAMMGVMMYSMNAQQSVVLIMKNQRRPVRNLRDVNVAFSLTAFTYLIVGLLFVLFFPNSFDCTQPVFLDNFSVSNLAAFNVRVMLGVQMVAIFPLRAHIFRVRLLASVFGRPEPGAIARLIFNTVVTVVWLVLAQFAARPGDIARFTGALAGLSLQFVLPIACQVAYLKNNFALSYSYAAAQSLVLLIGFAMAVGQFFKL